MLGTCARNIKSLWSEGEICLDSSCFASMKASQIKTRTGCWSSVEPSPGPAVLHGPLLRRWKCSWGATYCLHGVIERRLHDSFPNLWVRGQGIQWCYLGGCWVELEVVNSRWGTLIKKHMAQPIDKIAGPFQILKPCFWTPETHYN